MASCFNILIRIWHIRYFFFTFFPAIIWTWETSLEDWKMLIRWCRTDICSCKLSAKVFLMLDNPFLVPSLCKLNHISVCFIQISTKSSANSLFPSGKAMFFFWSHPRCFGPLSKFQHNIKISIKTARVSKLKVLRFPKQLSWEHLLTAVTLDDLIQTFTKTKILLWVRDVSKT